jgi:hypothetical protein
MRSAQRKKNMYRSSPALFLKLSNPHPSANTALLVFLLFPREGSQFSYKSLAFFALITIEKYRLRRISTSHFYIGAGSFM